MRHVAFFRGMNLGQRRSHSPTTAELLDALRRAGASAATNVQTNGTVIFAGTRPDQLARTAVELLGPVCGYSDAVVVRSEAWVRGLAATLDAALPGGEVALFDAREPPPVDAPWTDPASPLTIVALDARHAVTSWAAGRFGSTANPVLTGMLGVPVTCRGVGTMLRLPRRLDSPAPGGAPRSSRA